MLNQSIAFVDLETTGANPAHDRVIEIGVVKVTNGRVDFEWSTLVDPNQSIPAVIQSFIGITDDMVRGAPTFEQVADQVQEMLDGALFIAHNARFDYGFLKNEFRRLDMPFQPRVLCTVKFSRALYREYHKHGLDAVIARHNLACSARHRALGDARVLWDFVQLIHHEKTPEEIAAAMTKAMKSPSLPSGLDRVAIDAVSEGPGVYLFYGESVEGKDALPLYIGKAMNMRSRAQSHFAADHSSGRAMRLAQETTRIEWIETAGELGALLLEVRLVKQKSPIHNRHLRRNEELCAFRLIEGAPDVALELVPYNILSMEDVPNVFGCFKSKKEAINTLRELAAEHGLCHKRLGIEPISNIGKGKTGPCFAHQIKRCRGFCVGRESAAEHDLRLKIALSLVRLKNWPFPGRIAIHEHHVESGRSEWHLFESWCYLDTVKSETDLFEAAAARYTPSFDYDTYRILKRELEHHASKLDIVKLS